MTTDRPEPFQYDAELEPGTKRHVREPVGESYLGDPVAAPGHPLCHLVRLEPDTRDEIEREIERGEFDGYRIRSGGWAGDD